jgi:hypothetical protein
MWNAKFNRKLVSVITRVDEIDTELSLNFKYAYIWVKCSRVLSFSSLESFPGWKLGMKSQYSDYHIFSFRGTKFDTHI